MKEDRKVDIDCCMQTGGKWFRYRAAAIIIENGCVLFAHNESDDYYYSVGGGVHMGETAEQAVEREVFEETGIHYEIDRMAFIHENFFDGSGTLDGLKCHEIAFYFLMKPNGTRNLTCNSITQTGERENLHWIPVDRLGEYKAFPIFLKDKINNIGNTIEHIITRE